MVSVKTAQKRHKSATRSHTRPAAASKGDQAVPALRLEWRSPQELAENPANWRTHPEPQISALTDAIAQVGWAGACLYNERTKRLIDGHARRKVALEQGAEKVPVLVGSWTEEQERTILATLDPLSAMAEADKGKLEDLLKSITADGAVGAMLDELAQRERIDLNPVEPGAGGDEFDATPQDGPTRCKVGDLWVIGGVHRLLVGDCTVKENVERLMGGEKAGLIWSDPPYGVNHSGGSKDPRAPTYRSGDKIQNDALDEGALRSLVSAAYAAVPASPGATAYAAAPPGPLLLLFAEAMRDAGYPNRGHVVWVKPAMVFGRSLYHYRHEPILYGWRDDGPHYEDGDRTITSVFEVAVGEERPDHPTPKPLGLLMPMIQHSSKSGDIVYDPFLGSGTTIIAAHRLKRRCYGCEIAPRYGDVILKRCEAEGLTVEKQ
jgi:DNA modification methylase